MSNERSSQAEPALRVLVIDDDEDIRLAARDVLEWSGMEVWTAEDGLAGMQRLRQGPRPDVILLDLMMPRMNGFEFLEALRQSQDHSGIPVVVVSANQGYPAEELQVVRMLRKPMSIEVLVAAVREAVSARVQDRARTA